MAKIILICGKIASGKSFYAKQLIEKQKAVILNTDELTYAMFNNEQGEKYMELAQKANKYLIKKTVEIINAGSNVILDWGFWSSNERKKISKYFESENIDIEWHYVKVDNLTWEKNIAERNDSINKGNNKTDFYVTEGLKNKLILSWEEPTENEIDILYELKR